MTPKDASQELYQQVILEHNKKPRNFGKPATCTHSAEGFNPLCGDHIWVFLEVSAENIVTKISFTGEGCAICKASASLMTTELTGKTVTEITEILTQFQSMVKGDLNPDNDPHSLGKAKVFKGIWHFPSRIKCASLAWHTTRGALDQNKTITTE